MKTISLSEFRNHPQGVLDRLRRTHESVVLTKRGRPVARMESYERVGRAMKVGALQNRLIAMGDVVSPTSESDWEVCSEE